MGFDDAVAFALTLSDTVQATHYGQPAVKVAATGRAFLSQGREPEASFCLTIDRDTIEMLIETDPATFYQTPHYAGWDAVLVRYDATDPDRVRHVIEQAHGQAAARPPVRKRR
jgi:hypothetical protein